MMGFDGERNTGQRSKEGGNKTLLLFCFVVLFENVNLNS